MKQQKYYNNKQIRPMVQNRREISEEEAEELEEVRG